MMGEADCCMKPSTVHPGGDLLFIYILAGHGKSYIRDRHEGFFLVKALRLCGLLSYSL